MDFAQRLANLVRTRRSQLVVGLDPVLERMPAALVPPGTELDQEAAADAIVRFNSAVLEAVAPFAVAAKPQVAFYEQWGVPGWVAYQRTIALARDAGLLVIGDVKRGDTGSTSEAYARAHLTSPGAADAITINPYLGTDGLQPFVNAAREHGRGVFVLVRTSNPSAAAMQDVLVDGRPYHQHVAQLVASLDEGDADAYGCVGAVVGGTAPEVMHALRSLLPRAWFLVPGIGAQGGRPEDLGAAFDREGLGALVSASRSVLYAAPRDHAQWTGVVADAARDLRNRIRDVAPVPC